MRRIISKMSNMVMIDRDKLAKEDRSQTKRRGFTDFKTALKVMETSEMTTPKAKGLSNWNRTPKKCLKQKYVDCFNPFSADLKRVKVEMNAEQGLEDFPKLDLGIGTKSQNGTLNKFGGVGCNKKEEDLDLDFEFLLQSPRRDTFKAPNFENKVRKIEEDFNSFKFHQECLKVKRTSIEFEMDYEMVKYQEDNIFSDTEESETGIFEFKQSRKSSEHFLNRVSKNLSLLILTPGKNTFSTPFKSRRIRKTGPPKIRSRPRKRRPGRQIEYFLANMNLDRTMSSIGNIDIFAEHNLNAGESSSAMSSAPGQNQQILGTDEDSRRDEDSSGKYPGNQNSARTPRTPIKGKQSLILGMTPELNSLGSISELRIEGVKGFPQVGSLKSFSQADSRDFFGQKKHIRQRKQSNFIKKHEHNKQNMIGIYNPNVIVGYKPRPAFPKSDIFN